MKDLVAAIEIYEEIKELAKIGLTNEEIIGYIDFFFENKIISDYTN